MGTLVPSINITRRTAQISGMSQAAVDTVIDAYKQALVEEFSTGENKEVEIGGLVKIEEMTMPGGTATPPGMTEPYTYGPYQRVSMRPLTALKNAINMKSANNRLIEQEQPQLFMQLMDGEI